MKEQQFEELKKDLECYYSGLEKIYLKKLEILDELFMKYDTSLTDHDYEMFSVLMNDFIKKKILKK
jgi:hypothetical protein